MNVKLDREIRENVHFLAPHDPDRSRFNVSAIATSGTDDRGLLCTAKLHAVLDAGNAFARAHGFPPPQHPEKLDRTVRFTAHRGDWDTYVEVVGVDAPSVAAAVGPTRGAR